MPALTAELVNIRLNNSVLFLREHDVIVTSDFWNAVVTYDVTPYEEVLNTLQGDVLVMKKAAEQSTYLGELRQM
jgi:hypothetical protein